MELTCNRSCSLEEQWSEEFTKIFAILSASNPDDYWMLRLVDRLPTDPSAPSALDAASTHSTHSTDSNSKEEDLPAPPELSQEVSLIDQCKELPNPPEFSADYDEVEIVNAHIFPLASSPSPLPPPPLLHDEAKEEPINQFSEIQTADRIVLEENPISTEAPSVNIEDPPDESLIAVTVRADESKKNNCLSHDDFQNENEIQVQIITPLDDPNEMILKDLPSQPQDTPNINQPIIEEASGNQQEVDKREVIVTLNDIETEIAIKTEKLYDSLDKYVQSTDDWVQIEDPQCENPRLNNLQSEYVQPPDLSFAGAELTIDGNDLSETSTAESFHFVGAPEAPQPETLPLNDEAAPEPVQVEGTNGTTNAAPKMNASSNDIEINEASWKLERRKLILSRKGSMGRFLGRIMHSKRLQPDRLPAVKPVSTGESEPPKRPPRRKTLANLDLSREELQDPSESKKSPDSERSATLSSMDRRRKGSLSRLVGRVISSKNINAEVSPEEPDRPPSPLPPPAESKRDSFGDFLRRIIPNRSKQPAQVAILPDESKVELPVTSIPVQTVPLRPDGWTAPTVKTAKVKFQCQKCQHKWSSARGIAAFTCQLAKNEESGAGYGEVVVRFYGQQCYRCPSGDYEKAEWSPAVMRTILSDICTEIGQQFYPEQSEWKRLKATKGHRRGLCQACDEGVCTSGKDEP